MEYAEDGSQMEPHPLEAPALDLSTAGARVAEAPSGRRIKREVISIAQLLENFDCDDSFVTNNPSAKVFLVNGAACLYADCLGGDWPEDYSTQHRNNGDNNGTTMWDAAVNTDPPLLVDRASQTEEIRPTRRDSWAQTDLRVKESRMNIRYSCRVCQRGYATRQGYEKHIRTHMRPPKVSNVRFTTQAKFQVYKRDVKENSPVVIQVPNSSTAPRGVQCYLCKEWFPSQEEKEGHYDDCILEPFEQTQCPHCPLRFYTPGCLREHCSRVHPPPSTSAPAPAIEGSYYCIFCYETFESAYNFHLHLEKHMAQ